DMAVTTPLLPLLDSSGGGEQTHAQADARPQRGALWLAIYFPKIALEAVVAEQREIAAAVTTRKAGRDVIHTASRLATKSGVRRGMALSAAYALCPTLEVQPVERVAQQKRLRELAVLLQRFTPRISVSSANALLLEVRGSIVLFGSLEAIQTDIAACLSGEFPHAFYFAVSPTPAASLLLARAGSSVTVVDRQQLRSALGSIPIDYLPLHTKQRQRLVNTGVQVLRDLWRLPADQLARRLGAGVTRYLAQVLGQHADVRETFQVEQGFCCSEEFLYEVSDLALMGEAAYGLLQELSEFLYCRDAGIDRFALLFFHERRAATRIDIGLSSATRDVRRLFFLLETRLQALTLDAPVVSLELRADNWLPFKSITESLIPDGNSTDSGSDAALDTLLDELQIRLGEGAVGSVSAVAEHRPEYACRYAPLTQVEQTPLNKRRPQWLLDQPLRLPVRDGQPCHRGVLRRVDGPERIESGWWSGGDVRRDYYIAAAPDGALLWIFHNLNEPDHWYLHGLFA
ncbi:MAG: DNA polymerase Y family protein, partial [Pseudomonadota bacterium]